MLVLVGLWIALFAGTFFVLWLTGKMLDRIVAPQSVNYKLIILVAIVAAVAGARAIGPDFFTVTRFVYLHETIDLRRASAKRVITCYSGGPCLKTRTNIGDLLFPYELTREARLKDVWGVDQDDWGLICATYQSLSAPVGPAGEVLAVHHPEGGWCGP